MSVRALVMAIASGLLLVMAVHYGAIADDHRLYPTTGAVEANYDDHVGDEFYVWAEVIDVGPETITVRSRPVVLTIETSAEVEVDQTIQVYGTLAPGHRLDAERIVAPDGASRPYMIAISLLALPVTAVAFFRSWRFDVDALAFVPREGG